MLRLSATLMNQPVVSLRLGGAIAIAKTPVINPHNLKILGWWCKESGHPEPKILLIEDIRQASSEGLAVNDEDVLSSPSDLVRHREILDIKFDLLGKTVRTKRSKLGKINDYSYNEGMFVQKLYVARPVTKILATQSTLIIDRTQILEVTDSYILVRDTEVTADAPEFAAAPAT